jgi:glycosyltransferase involved in cell wall biosynthesis
MALAKLGQPVRVLTTHAEPQQYWEDGVEVIRFPVIGGGKQTAGMSQWLSFLCRASGQLRASAADFAPDVIHSHFLFPSGYVVACAGLDVPHVSSAVGAEIHDPSRKFSADRNWLMRRLVRRVVQTASVITSSSRDLSDRLYRLYDDRQLVQIGWGVPPVIGDGRGRDELGLRDGDFVISTVCRLVRRKRVDVLLRAVAQLANERVFAVIMGDGPLEEELRQQAVRLGIADRVRFAGWVSEADKAAYLGVSDVFCLPSSHEGFGLVFIEAMSVGTPVVTTNVGGQIDIVRDQVDGSLVPPDDADALAARLAELIHDPEKLRGMQRSVVRRAREFSPLRSAEAFANVYAQVCGVRRSSSQQISR